MYARTTSSPLLPSLTLLPQTVCGLHHASSSSATASLLVPPTAASPALYLLPQTVVSTTVGGVSLECSMGTDNDYQIPKAMIAVCNDHK